MAWFWTTNSDLMRAIKGVETEQHLHWETLRDTQRLLMHIHRVMRNQLLIEARQVELLKKIYSAVREPLPTPGPIRAQAIGEDMADQILYNVQLPAEPPEPNDIEGGKLTISGATADGEALVDQVVDTVKGRQLVEGLKGPQGASLSLTFAYVDDAGNLSENSATASIVLDDTVPPADPGALSVVVTGEEPEAPVTEEPTAEDPPTEDPPAEDGEPADALADDPDGVADDPEPVGDEPTTPPSS